MLGVTFYPIKLIVVQLSVVLLSVVAPFETLERVQKVFRSMIEKSFWKLLFLSFKPILFILAIYSFFFDAFNKRFEIKTEPSILKLFTVVIYEFS